MRPLPCSRRGSRLLGLVLGLLVPLGAEGQEGGAPAGRDTERLELERYGFSRRFSRDVAPRPTPPEGELDPGGIPTPRRRSSLPDQGRAAPPPAPATAAPLELRDLPGATRVPVGRVPVPEVPGSAPATYVGDGNCLQCHAEKAEDPERSHMALSRHSASLPAERRGCEGCHGPGSKHWGDPDRILNPADQEPEVLSRTCLDCHKMQGLTGAHDWFFSRHASAKLSCLTCHQIHDNPEKALLTAAPDAMCMACHKRVAGEFAMRSHHPVRREGFRPLRSLTRGKVSCLDCHDPHGSPEPHAMLRDGLDDTCARCHPGHEGPFVFPHVPDRGQGACLQCHLPHGGPHRNLLRSRDRGACVQCHSDQAVGHFPGLSCASQSCHVAVHGSNTSPLFFR